MATPLPSFDNLKQGSSSSGFLGHLGSSGDLVTSGSPDLVTSDYPERTNVSPPLTPPNSLEMAEYLSMQDDLFGVQLSGYNNNQPDFPENTSSLPENHQHQYFHYGQQMQGGYYSSGHFNSYYSSSSSNQHCYNQHQNLQEQLQLQQQQHLHQGYEHHQMAGYGRQHQQQQGGRY